MDEIIKEISKKLNITIFELRKIISQILVKETYQEDLIELLGYENISLAEQICKNKEFFETKEESGENKKYYAEFCLPEIKSANIDEKILLSTSCTEEDAKFFEYTKFNFIQSQVFECAYKTDTNFLVCAPTGSGKTDVALLGILRALKRKNSKIIYIVPMKALACEITHKYKSKLKNYNVIEFTGDTELSNRDLLKSDLIICTPEKFDAYTRKLNNIFQNFINLVIIDEIHILQDDRGSVLESIVCRIFRYIELQQKHIRIIGLSATLPNYEDVGKFLKTNKIFYFDQRYRPVSLKTSIIGIYQNTTRKQADALFVEKIEKFRRDKKQVLIFVTARHETINTSKLLINTEYTTNLDRKCKLNDILEYLLIHKIGIHHAGLPRNIRLYMENKFKKGDIDILVCTSTLAWGVNLPAHVVVIKGTTFYDPTLGKFKDLGILDVFQIFGRAGRPQYKITGEAVLITEYKKVGSYLNMIKNNQDVESKLLRHVANLINSEIYLNSINNIAEGLNWFKNTFMYVRSKKNPSLYGLEEKDINDEDTVLSEYIYLTVMRLEECGLITVYKNDSESYLLWKFYSTEFGRISSFYYLDHETIYDWIKNIDFLCSTDDILKLLLTNKDFTNIQIRKDEEYNLAEMASNLNIEIKNTTEFKLLVLAIAHIKKYPISNFALKCDLGFVAKNIERILSAFIEFLLYMKRWNLLLFSLEIFSKLQPTTKILKEKQSYTINLLDCGSYIYYIFKSDRLKYFYLIFYIDNQPVFITRECNAFIRIEKQPFYKIVVYDLASNKFYEEFCKVGVNETIDDFLKTGYHSCEDIKLLNIHKKCQHIKLVDDLIRKQYDTTGTLVLSGKYDVDINFYVTNMYFYKEVLKQFVTFSLEHLKNESRLLIVCREKSEYQMLSQEILTRLALDSFESGTKCKRKVVHEINKISKNTICIVTFSEAMLVTDNVFVILLSCRNSLNEFLSIYDILQLCHRKKTIIYECEEFIEYFRYFILEE